MKDSEIIAAHYDQNPQGEWDRLERDGRLRPEFVITAQYIERYVRPGDRVLDLGGGPGRYSLHLAKMGCDVTLADLSDGNVAFAREKAKEMGLSIKAVQANALDLSGIKGRDFDHVLCMGPLYHLLQPWERELCVENCLSVLKPGGLLFASFIQNFAGALYCLKYAPELILDEKEESYFDCVKTNRSFAGDAFTRAFNASVGDILSLFAPFPLRRLHLLGCEGILSPNEPAIMAQPDDVYNAWLDLSMQLCEREGLLAFSEHSMYIGQKKA